MPNRLNPLDASAPPPSRDCLECRKPDGMKLQNSAVFTAHYICVHCGTALTIPPPPLVIPPKHFDGES